MIQTRREKLYRCPLTFPPLINLLHIPVPWCVLSVLACIWKPCVCDRNIMRAGRTIAFSYGKYYNSVLEVVDSFMTSYLKSWTPPWPVTWSRGLLHDQSLEVVDSFMYHLLEVVDSFMTMYMYQLLEVVDSFMTSYLKSWTPSWPWPIWAYQLLEVVDSFMTSYLKSWTPPWPVTCKCVPVYMTLYIITSSEMHG